MGAGAFSATDRVTIIDRLPNCYCIEKHFHRVKKDVLSKDNTNYKQQWGTYTRRKGVCQFSKEVSNLTCLTSDKWDIALKKKARRKKYTSGSVNMIVYRSEVRGNSCNTKVCRSQKSNLREDLKKFDMYFKLIIHR